MFARRARGKTAGSKSASVDLELEDFTIEKTQQYFEAWGLDPGRNYVYVAVDGTGPASHQVRRVSTKEYHAMTGSTRRARRMQKQKDAYGISRIETQMNNAKQPRWKSTRRT